MKSIAANLLSIVCVGVAAWMAVSKVEGWGWFIFVEG